MAKPNTYAPFDREGFHDEVWARLKEINDPRRIAAFVAHVALAVSPGLAKRAEEQGFLWYWEEAEREQYLFAVCQALQLAYAAPFDLRIMVYADAFAAAYAAAADADADAAAYAAAYAAYAAVYAADATDVARAADAADATRAAADAADHWLVDWIRVELKRLAKARDVAAYVRAAEPVPNHPLREQFLSELRRLPTFEYWAYWFQARFDNKPIDPVLLEKSVELPEEIANQDPRAINRYLAELAAGERTEGIKRVRAIFIGDGEAGKTSLIQALNGEAVTEGGTDMTCGVDISEWPVAGTDLRAHFWDFGGQVIAHATHQFFLRARCVYVLVLNARSTGHDPNQQAEYWLEFVRAFGDDAPVLLVVNKWDLTPVHVDMHRLTRKHPNIRGFHGLSATRYGDEGELADRFARFRQALVHELTEVGKVQPYFLKSESAILDGLRVDSRRDPFLKKGVFEAKCQERGIEGEARRTFLERLDQLGEIIWFPDSYRLQIFTEYLLNPRWLTHGVYHILYSDLLRRQNGALSFQNAETVLQGSDVRDEDGNRFAYPPERLAFLLGAMEQFQLCYPAPGEPGAPAGERWIVPDLLPSDRPEHIDFDERDALRFDFRFDTLLPRHVLSQFMVRHHQDIRGHQIWQHGVCLESGAWNGPRALVEADYQTRVLSLAVRGPHVDKYFAVLYDSVLDILGRMPKLEYLEQLRLDERARIGEEGIARHRGGREKEIPRESYHTLLALEAAGQKQLICEFGTYDLERLLKPLPRREGKMTGDESGGETDMRQNNKETWQDIMLAFSGLGGLVALIGGLIAVIKGLYPLLGSVGMVAGGVALGGVALVAWLRYQKKSRR
uniref:non-specific serine/threonine protein kinase n=1 Tax=Candidatus Kentrum sp. MB TaxID=2138164 RepID=A0A450XVL4_9GAMM|nr:MAG: Ras of Complex, Roc, domain of DAPkinase [Candidatus Kentron sp. MB]VFK76132.1 MAG: Ras of Complex, Roc, domain of DAPkinase [Candidatus Kentron sp. MB]